MFSPLAFPTGMILLNLSTSIAPTTHRSLSPFELYREPLIVIAIADGKELGQDGVSVHEVKEGAGSPRTGDTGLVEEELKELLAGLEHMERQYASAIVHRILLFDYVQSTVIDQGKILLVPPPEASRTTTIKTLMCDLTGMILAEMTSYAKTLQGLQSIESPSTARSGVTANGHLWTRQEMDGTAQGHRSRSESPAGSLDRSQVRASLPAQLPSRLNVVEEAVRGARSSSPSDGARAPPTTFDGISGASQASGLSTAPSKSSARAVWRNQSRERVSVQGLGSGSLSERARNNGKARASIAIGALYLQAGRWPDAIREFVDGASVAKANNDYLWHAKALENILVSLLMLGWAGMDFQIPSICYPLADKTASTKTPNITPSESSTDVNLQRLPGTTNRLVSLQNLTNLLPELLTIILNLYTRAANFTAEALPQIVSSESIIRFSKLLTTVHLCNGQLHDDALQHLVLSTPLPKPTLLSTIRAATVPSKTEISSMLLKAFPSSSSSEEQLSVAERVIILSGIVSVFSTLGFHRKKAFVLRELLSVLIPGLVQARKLGAAEMGVHPAAGLLALDVAGRGPVTMDSGTTNVQDREGVQEVLDVLGRVYGIVGSRVSGPSITEVPAHIEGPHPTVAGEDDSTELMISRMLRQGTLRAFGSLHLKTDVLRSCINLCEALPDLHGVLHFTSDLLRTAGSGIAPKSDSSDGSAALHREDQIRLANNISRTVSAAKQLGMQGLETEYWDDFLVRGVDTGEQASWKKPIPHAKSEIETAAVVEKSKEVGPFIYNPFLKKTNASDVKPILVAGEHSDFRVTLQNLFEFQIEIEQLSLESNGVEFISQQQSAFVGPYCTQTLSLSGVAESTGSLQITGCFVKILGCRKRRFPIFSDPWSPPSDTNIKVSGLAAAELSPARPVSNASELSRKARQQSLSSPKVTTLNLKVIGAQPVVVIKSTSLSQSAITVLEGETRSFTITLHNKSSKTPVDLLIFSFQDNTMLGLQDSLNNKETLPAERYEIELRSARKKAFRWRQKEGGENTTIPPGQIATYEFEVLGKPGLSSGIVQIDYAHLGVPRSEVKETFYTRQVTLPVTVAVNASVTVVGNDLLPFIGDFAWSNQQKQLLANRNIDGQSQHQRSRTVSKATPKGKNRFQSLLERLGLGSHGDDHCLLLLDVRNSWPNPLSISLQVRENTFNDYSLSDSWRRAYTVHEVLQPGHISRLVLLLPRLLLKHPHAPIPALNPANQRQYVVSASKISPETERANREVFWYREEVLKHIRGSWEEDSTGRSGDIDLRGLKLTTRMVDALKIEDVGMEMSVIAPEAETTSKTSVRQTGRSKFSVPTDDFLTLKTTIHNRSQKPIFPLLRLQPSLRNQPHTIALDLSKRFVWHGVLQRALPLLQQGASMEVEVGICLLCSGEYEVGATVEEVRVWKADASEVKDGGSECATSFVEDHLLERTERRVWHAREGNIALVFDRLVLRAPYVKRLWRTLSSVFESSYAKRSTTEAHIQHIAFDFSTVLHRRRSTREAHVQQFNHIIAVLNRNASDASIMSNTQSVSASPLNRIPQEIRLRIFKYALKAVDEIIDVTIPSHDRVRARPKPVLGVGLLRTCHQYYHEARPYLYHKKKLLFARYGWELLAWTKPMGLPRCKELGCVPAVYRPVLDHATLCIGHPSNRGHGQTSMTGFDATLQQILNAGGIRINKLVIKFARHSFHLTYRPFMLAQRLQAITGVERVEIVGGGLEREDREALYISLFGVRQYADYFNWYQNRYISCADLRADRTPTSPANPPCHTPASIAVPNSMPVDPQLLCHVDQQLSRLQI